MLTLHTNTTTPAPFRPEWSCDNARPNSWFRVIIESSPVCSAQRTPLWKESVSTHVLAASVFLTCFAAHSGSQRIIGKYQKLCFAVACKKREKRFASTPCCCAAGANVAHSSCHVHVPGTSSTKPCWAHHVFAESADATTSILAPDVLATSWAKARHAEAALRPSMAAMPSMTKAKPPKAERQTRDATTLFATRRFAPGSRRPLRSGNDSSVLPLPMLPSKRIECVHVCRHNCSNEGRSFTTAKYSEAVGRGLVRCFPPRRLQKRYLRDCACEKPSGSSLQSHHRCPQRVAL